jgi:hypothetical protein
LIWRFALPSTAAGVPPLLARNDARGLLAKAFPRTGVRSDAPSENAEISGGR